jgi:hypothetical protein
LVSSVPMDTISAFMAQSVSMNFRDGKACNLTTLW